MQIREREDYRMKQFSKQQCDLLIKCSDEPGIYKVNINPNNKAVKIINSYTDEVLTMLGYSNALVEKLIDYCCLIISTKDI